jgi:hypothetical protein
MFSNRETLDLVWFHAECQIRGEANRLTIFGQDLAFP